jgi:hypothetical protein
MATDRTGRSDAGNDRDLTTNREEQRSTVPNDLPDNEHDRARLQPEETTINLPDVKDIPGQEFVNAPPAGSMADTTISSEDEEGDDIFDRDDNEEGNPGTRFDVSTGERKALEDTTYLPTADENQLRRARMDNTDFQGEALNENSFGVGQVESDADLDIPDSTDETNTDALGQGDEENKYYSLGSDDNDNVTEGTP